MAIQAEHHMTTWTDFYNFWPQAPDSDFCMISNSIKKDWKYLLWQLMREM